MASSRVAQCFLTLPRPARSMLIPRPHRPCRLLCLAAFRSMASSTGQGSRKPARRLVRGGHHPDRRRARRPRHLPVSKALPPVPAMGRARRGSEAVTARHSHPSGLRPLACLPGAIVFDDEILSQETQKLSHPCNLCAGKPCLSACPVNAFSDDGYDVQLCRAYLSGGEGRACMDGGCKARLACPVGRDYV
jgi:hypothetical protein